MVICIYKITSPSNKVYIGQSWDWVKRRSVYKRIACPEQRFLYNSLRKHGFEAHNIELLKKFSKDILQETLNFWETYYWKYYKDLGFSMLNIREPGSRGKLSEETKRKMSSSLKGRKVSEENRQKFIKFATGRVKSKEELHKLSLTHKGKIVSKETRLKLSKIFTGRKMLPEVIEKCRLSKLGTICKEETKKKIGEANKGSKNGMYGRSARCKKVLNVATGQMFSSAKEAAQFYNMKPYNLAFRLNGRVKNDTSLVYLDNESITKGLPISYS